MPKMVLRIFENETLESVMRSTEHLDAFVITYISEGNRAVIDSMTVGLFDEVGVLYLVDSIDQQKPDTYHLSVPFTCKEGIFRGVLDTDVMLGEENKLIFKDYPDRDLRVCKKDRGFSTAGMTLLAKREYSGLNKIFQKIIDKIPFTYHFSEPKNRLDDFFVGFDPKQINVKTEAKGERFRHKGELNIFPILVQMTRGNSAIGRFDRLMTSVEASVEASVGAYLATLYFTNEAEDVRSSGISIDYFPAIAACLLLKSFRTMSYSLNNRYEVFNHCKRALKEITERNRALSVIVYHFAQRESDFLGETHQERNKRLKSMRRSIFRIDDRFLFEGLTETGLQAEQRRIEAAQRRLQDIQVRLRARSMRKNDIFFGD